MKYKKFNIISYKALVDSGLAIIDTPVPIIGVNESGKSSALEAVAHFDYRNDELIRAKQWKFINRYKPEDVEFKVSCDIEMTQAELDDFIGKNLLPVPAKEPEQPVEPEVVATPESVTDPATVQAVVEQSATTPEPQAQELTTPEPEPKPAEPIQEDELKSIALNRDFLTITRVFNSQSDTILYSIGGMTNERTDKLARDIISKLPRIYYFDNFLEKPMPDMLTFSNDYVTGKTDVLSEYQKIVEGAFSDANVSLRDYFTNSDVDTKETWISRVNDNVTKKIIDEWRKMHVPEGELDDSKFNDIKIAFQPGDKKYSISIKIKETFPGTDNTPSPPTTMKLNERSQGFRWFFNFSARKCFAAIHQEQFLYLFDEPGSYLHNTAQTVLLDALISLAHEHPIIYSTHSEFLLDPEKININDIKVVQKENHAIQLIPLSNTKTKKHEGALSTLYNALKMRIPLEPIANKKVIVTEGVTDFYFWKPLLDVVFLPGCGASANRYLLSIAIGASKKYVALFDSDRGGEQAQTHYKSLFGDDEAANWLSYQNAQSNPSGLERLLSDADVTKIKSITNQQDTKQAITLLFFDNKTDEFWNGIDATTKANVQHNISKIASHLGLVASNIKLGFTV